MGNNGNVGLGNYGGAHMGWSGFLAMAEHGARGVRARVCRRPGSSAAQRSHGALALTPSRASLERQRTRARHLTGGGREQTSPSAGLLADPRALRHHPGGARERAGWRSNRPGAPGAAPMPSGRIGAGRCSPLTGLAPGRDGRSGGGRTGLVLGIPGGHRSRCALVACGEGDEVRDGLGYNVGKSGPHAPLGPSARPATHRPI